MTTLRIESTSAAGQTQVPLTFGQVFAPGDVPASSTLTGELADGTAVALQVDAKATHPDGSLRHAVISALVPSLGAGQSAALVLSKAPQGSGGSVLTPAGLLSAGFTARVNVQLGGQTYTASADDALRSGAYTAWLSGPVAGEWLVAVPLKTSQGAEHPHLSARFAIRAYAGSNRARVDVSVENDWAYEAAPQNFTYDVQVLVGGQPVYAKAGLTHYRQTRWRKVFWWNGEPQAHLRHETAYLIRSRAVANYDQSVAVSPAAIVQFKARFSGAAAEPMGPGVSLPAMNTAGGRADIGLLPGWAAMYLLSMDRDAKAVTLGTADLAGSRPMHYRDKHTGRPISLVDYPYMTIAGHHGDTFNPATKQYEEFPACSGACANAPNDAPDGSHQPAFAYLPYLVTGDFYYLEELQFWAMWNLFWSNPGYRNNIQALFNRDQVRAQAWILRNLAEAAYITPDGDPFKAQFTQFLDNNLNWYNAEYAHNATAANALGAITSGNAMVYDGGTGLAPWQDDFFTSAVGRTAELGFSQALPLLQWKAQFPVGRMAGSGYCWINASVYTMHLRDSASSPFYTTWAQAYQASTPAAALGQPCASQGMAAALGLGQAGEMVGYADSAIGFPANLQPALAYSATSGIAGAAAAWQTYAGRSVKQDYTVGPQFAIVPRH